MMAECEQCRISLDCVKLHNGRWLCADCIIEDLEAEIERLRGELYAGGELLSYRELRERLLQREVENTQFKAEIKQLRTYIRREYEEHAPYSPHAHKLRAQFPWLGGSAEAAKKGGREMTLQEAIEQVRHPKQAVTGDTDFHFRCLDVEVGTILLAAIERLRAEPIQHAGDCTIYAALHNGYPTDGICTCGYGLSRARKGDWSTMFSAARKRGR